MDKINVQFADNSESEVVAVMAGAGEKDTYPHQGVIEVDDPRYISFFEKLSPFAKINASLPKPA